MKREVIEITDRASWAQMRQRDLTASRIAALFDQHPFLFRQRLAEQLRGRHQKIDTYSLRCGRILEPGVAVALLESRPDWKLVKATSYHRLPDLRIGATPDFFLGDALVEVTTISPAQWRGMPPAYKIIQLYTQLAVTGRKHGWLAVMVRTLPELPLHVFEVPPDPIIAEAILDAAATWWRHFDAGQLAPAAQLPPLGDWDPQNWKPPPTSAVARTRDVDIAAVFGAALRGRP
jgi:YqaJ-like recombinase protein